MTYLLVKWDHSSPDEPSVLYSEIDDQRMERRKIDIYPDGRWGFADDSEEAGGSGLGEAPMPSIEQLNADPDYEATQIDKDEFERLWAVRRSARFMTPFPLNHEGGEPS
jgi:hypothetical protein